MVGTIEGANTTELANANELSKGRAWFEIYVDRAICFDLCKLIGRGADYVASENSA